MKKIFLIVLSCFYYFHVWDVRKNRVEQAVETRCLIRQVA